MSLSIFEYAFYTSGIMEKNIRITRNNLLAADFFLESLIKYINECPKQSF